MSHLASPSISIADSFAVLPSAAATAACEREKSEQALRDHERGEESCKSEGE